MAKGNIKPSEEDEITRKEAIKKLGVYGKYAALTALGTYMILQPQKAQSMSPPGAPPPPPPDHFNF